jgi:hypothetical protein
VELSYDWRGFQSMFLTPASSRKPGPGGDSDPRGAVFLVTEGETVVAAYSDGDDLADWIGATVHEARTGLPHREVVVLDREKLDSWVDGSLGMAHLHEQAERWRDLAALPSAASDGTAKHFLLEAVAGWWAKALPSAYGILVRAESGKQSRDFLVIIRRGRLDQFHEPDLSPMGNERRNQAADVVRYLSEKHALPIQGIFVPAQEWTEWSKSTSPWRAIAQSVRANRTKLVPFRWGLATLMATRAYFRV